jgi:hypothetical protein
MQTIIETEEKPLGVIESLQQGFNFLNHYLWLIIIPVFLDFFLWLGPRLSISSLINQLIEAIPPQPEMPSELVANFDTAIESLKSLGAGYNLFSLLAGLLTGLPSIFTRLDFQTELANSASVIELTSWQSALLWSAALIPLGVLIGSFWLAHIVSVMQRERPFSQLFLKRWGWIWLNINLYLIILFLGILFFSLFFGLIGAFFLTFFGAAGAALFSILWLLFIGFSIWLSIGLYFVVYAVASDGVNLVSAIWRSLNVVGRNAMSTLGFLILTLLLIEGFSRIWLALGHHVWGVVLSVCGNAYLGTAIVAAAIFFYQSRYQQWQKTRSLVILSQQSDSNNKT